ncbi:acetyl-CoA acetyltransferase [Trematosphaeria pertusa]|uniref:acetyl-CoA C-acetyltransferase n=1 Tax=Trematosphaeria pertusa TaxID=390896 RepID=A0A6A6ID88_9PLEO|nr:acetyl-CoA acetyltransferase [Trematosphaeria pertusa]KAF2247862.1 acetyl-CoA acetyltransferase [Trematosphaeria pertusa]
MSTAAARTSFRMASRPQQRLASIQRQFSTSSPQRREIRDAYIISGSRTPSGMFNGAFTTVPATQLGATAIKSALEKSKVPISSIDAVYMGNVLSAGVGQAPARQAAIFAGLPTTIEATTINKVCASGLKAVSIAAQDIELGKAEAQVAGGFENMTRVPYYLNRASQQPPFGHQQLQDGLIGDGLWDVYNQIHMGNCAENTAKKYEISRQEQDDFAILTYKRAQEAWKAGLFKDEVAPVTVKSKKGEVIVSEDEGYNKLKLEKVPTLKPAFVKGPDGTVTAANSSSFSDGASALVLGSKEIAQQYGKDSRVLAKIITYADAAQDPIDFPIAPSAVVEKLFKQSGLSKSDIAVWEFNEAFAAVIKANAKILGLGTENVNPRGGAIALGHALGSSGSRILVTLLHQLEVGQYGAAAICNGGGAATGMIVQRISPSDL